MKSTGDNLAFVYDPAPSEKVMCRHQGGQMNLICLSWGEMQTKLPTLIELWRKEKGEVLTERKAMELALDTEKMLVFIPEVLINQVGSFSKWTACEDNKTWFQEKIDKVRALQAEITRFENYQ